MGRVGWDGMGWNGMGSGGQRSNKSLKRRMKKKKNKKNRSVLKECDLASPANTPAMISPAGRG